MHHKYKGEKLNDDQLSEVDAFLTEHLDAEGLQELDVFSINRESYNNLADICDNPITFWSGLDHIFKKLASLAKKIFIMPASTARIEGLFSQWTYVHDNYRNRLGDLSSSQLIDVYTYHTSIGPKYRSKPKKRHISLDDY